MNTIVVTIASSWCLALSKVVCSHNTRYTITIVSSWSFALIKVDRKRIYLNSHFFFADDDSWDLVTCFCMKPFAGRAMIECNQCNTWIHLSCAKIRKSNVPETYICQRCKDSKFDIRRSNRSRVGSRKHLLDWCRSSRSAHPHVQKLIKMSSWRRNSMSTEEEGLADLPVSLFLFLFLIFLTFLNVCVRQSILRRSINESRFPPYGRLELWRYTPEGITLSELCWKEGIGVSDCTFF